MERSEPLRSSGEMRTSRRKFRKTSGKRQTKRKINAEQRRRDVKTTIMEIQMSCVAKKQLFSSASLETRFEFWREGGR